MIGGIKSKLLLELTDLILILISFFFCIVETKYEHFDSNTKMYNK